MKKSLGLTIILSLALAVTIANSMGFVRPSSSQFIQSNVQSPQDPQGPTVPPVQHGPFEGKKKCYNRGKEANCGCQRPCYDGVPGKDSKCQNYCYEDQCACVTKCQS